ncbi:MAG: hypothetical protein WC554_04000 [Clostridia bacterium]
MSLTNEIHDIYTKTRYVERHLHHPVRWWGKLNPQTAANWGVTMDGHLNQPYRAISGLGAYGSDPGDEAQIFTAADLPVGLVYGDFSEFLAIANSSNTVYLCRIVWGNGTLAAAIASGQYTEFPFFRPAADNNRKIAIVASIKIPTLLDGLPVKAWCQCQNVTNNATLDFFLGGHGYYF